VEFEWDPVKASRNAEKHAVDFVTAAEIFADPDLFVVIDSRIYGERRYQAIGTSRGVVLFVAYTMRPTTFAGLSAPGGRAVVKEPLIRYRPGRDPKPESRTDWDRLKRMSDEEVERAARDDPDAQPLSDKQLARGFRPRALTALRRRLGLSQAEFSRQFMLNLRTLQDWEQGRREPEDIARVYLRVIERNPNAVKAALED
jgi:putative transcriptional regulator